MTRIYWGSYMILKLRDEGHIEWIIINFKKKMIVIEKMHSNEEIGMPFQFDHTHWGFNTCSPAREPGILICKHYTPWWPCIQFPYNVFIGVLTRFCAGLNAPGDSLGRSIKNELHAMGISWCLGIFVAHPWAITQAVFRIVENGKILKKVNIT